MREHIYPNAKHHVCELCRRKLGPYVTFNYTKTGPHAGNTYVVHEDRYRYCNDRGCESQHSDPDTLWDTSSSRMFAEVYSEEAADSLIKAMMGLRDKELPGSQAYLETE